MLKSGLVIVFLSFFHFLCDAVPIKPKVLLNKRLNVKLYDGFRNLEAALIPVGTFIALNDISIASQPTPMQAKPVTTNSNLPGDIDPIQAMINEIVSEDELNQPQMSRPKTNRFFAGIKPLVAMDLPMGVFIPNDRLGTRITVNKRLVKAKLRRGLRRVFSKLRTLAKQKRDRATFDYVRTFNGLTALEAVYIPPGYFLPLNTVTDAVVTGNNTPATVRPALQKYYAGIIPLTAMELPGGVFIPRRMTGLPDLPIIIEPSPTGKPTIGVVSTVDPFPDEPDFPDVPSSTPPLPNSNSQTTTPCIDLGLIVGRQDAMPTICISNTTTANPENTSVTDSATLPNDIPPTPPIPPGSITLDPGPDPEDSTQAPSTIPQIPTGPCDNKTLPGCSSDNPGTTVIPGASDKSTPVGEGPNIPDDISTADPNTSSTAGPSGNSTNSGGGGDPPKSDSDAPGSNSTTAIPGTGSTNGSAIKPPLGPSADQKWLLMLPPGTQIKNVPATVELNFQPDEIQS